ncbi:MAG: putative porin [Planctomycetota bacterium]
MALGAPRTLAGTFLTSIVIVGIVVAALGHPGHAFGEEGPALDPEVVAKAVEEYLAARESKQSEWPWLKQLDLLHFFGDLRLRHESSVKRDGERDRHRERLRFRIGGNYQLLPDLQLGARLITGSSGDPNSPHVTLGDGFDSLEISLDRAFARYTPECLSGTWITAGKFGHAFKTNPVYGELVWDADIQPEGAAGGYTWKGAGLLNRLDCTIGQYVLLEQSGASDASISVAQLALTAKPCDGATATAAVGYYHYSSVDPDGSTAILADNQGNGTIDVDADGDADEYASRFGILNVVASASTPIAATPVTWAGELIANTRAGDRKLGWALGCAVGSTAEPGDWKAYYQWQVIEQESVFSAFVHDDFLLATNFRGHVFGAQYRAVKHVTLHLWTSVVHREHRGTTLRTNSESGQWNLRFDVNIDF